MSCNWFSSMFVRSSGPAQRSHRHRRARFESLERRDLLTTLFVDVNDPDAGTFDDNLFEQIHEAVGAADPGDTIKVHAGTYEPVTVFKPDLTIREANAKSDPVIDATGAAHGVTVVADGTTLRGLTVENATEQGFLLVSDNNRLTKNEAHHNDGSGIQLVGSSGNKLRRNTVSDNGGGVDGGDGFTLILGSNNNTFIGNRSSGNAFGGFSLLSLPIGFPNGNSGNTFVFNTASGNGLAGFVMIDQIIGATGGNSDNTLIANRSINNGDVGFLLDVGSGHNRLIGNTATGNAVDGFWVGSDDNTLIANKAHGNDRHGFAVRGGSGNTLSANRASGNGENGFLLDRGADNNTLTGNRATDNGEWGFNVDAVLANEFAGNSCLGNGLPGSNPPGIC